MILFAYTLVFILPLIALFVVAKTADKGGQWVTRDAVVLNIAILCVAVAALAVIELVLL